ncbi:hypothetical protein SDC9_152953 [bioreactor metagenome]|uniref:Uncharacterized protein n=1 Tax=bioreactor metagenome TaxID=1076179 RepID=A0A645EW87_9ZZZZ
MKDQVDSTGMVFHVEPVAHVFALSVNRKRFIVPDIVDEQRDQFLGELIRPVIVGTIGDNNR